MNILATKKRGFNFKILMVMGCLMTIPSYQAYADHRWGHAADLYDRDNNNRHNRENDDYTIKSTTTNEAGQPIVTRTTVERDRDEYTRTTTVKGPDGLISREKEDIEYDDDEITRTTRTLNPDGTVDTDKQIYEFNE